MIYPPHFLEYRGHKNNAKHRGIAWEFSFDSWVATWNASGKMHLRGRGADKYCMSRPGDVGPYSPENVRIVLCGDNVREAIAIRCADRPERIAYCSEKDAFFNRHGVTVLDWLKDAIDWHFKIAPIKMIAGNFVLPIVSHGQVSTATAKPD